MSSMIVCPKKVEILKTYDEKIEKERHSPFSIKTYPIPVRFQDLS